MNFTRFLIAISLIVAIPVPALFAAAEGSAGSTTETAEKNEGNDHAHGSGHHGLPPNAVPIFLEYKVETQVFDETGEPLMKDGKLVFIE